jgi:acetylornithine/succinyldiaminopimelate/putrescine aminotransferase
MWGIELDRPAGPVARALLDHGFVVGTAREKVLRLLPPYVVPKKALQEFVVTLSEVLRVAGCELRDIPRERQPASQPATGNSQLVA